MICHHCGQRYIEFFPNARQENLFIGMIHAFQYMGVPRFVLTDNMKSVVLHRDLDGHPVWQKDYFTSSQVAIARETRNILCADLSQNHTARELAERFQIAETSLKNYFRGVFGENLSTFLREARMRRAAELLQSSELRVAEIAAQVGYENQSKFAAVFVRRFGCPPLEYRRRARLSIADDD